MQPAPDYEGPVSSEALRGRIAFSGIPGLRSEVRAVLWKGSRKEGSFKGALVMRPPDDMRIVLYDTFGNTVVDIVRSDGTLEAYVPSKDAIYLGRAPSMMPEENAEFGLSTVKVEGGSRVYELSAGHEGRITRRYEFDMRSAVNTRATVLSENGSLMEARFSGYLAGLGGNVPGNVVLRYGSGFRLELSMIDPETGEVPERLIPIGRSASMVYDISDLEAAE